MILDVLLGRVSVSEYFKILKNRLAYKRWKAQNPKPKINPLRMHNLRVINGPHKKYALLIGECENQSVYYIEPDFSEIQVGEVEFLVFFSHNVLTNTEKKYIEPFESFKFSSYLMLGDGKDRPKNEYLNKPIRILDATYDLINPKYWGKV